MCFFFTSCALFSRLFEETDALKVSIEYLIIMRENANDREKKKRREQANFQWGFSTPPFAYYIVYVDM